MMQDGQGRRSRARHRLRPRQGHIETGLLPVPGTPAFRDAWQETITAADKYNEPGRFTAFIGYEWTSRHRRQQPAPQRRLPRRTATRRSQVEPFTAQTPLGSDNPRTSGSRWQAYEEKTGGEVLAIAHNGNLRNGLMFPTSSPSPASRSTASTPRRAPLGAALRGDADEGRRRGASLPVAERRVRQLRDLGQGQPRRERGQEAGDARVRVRARRRSSTV